MRKYYTDNAGYIARVKEEQLQNLSYMKREKTKISNAKFVYRKSLVNF